MKILVAGGTGFVGSYVIRRLLDIGEEVLCLVRNPESAKLPSSVKVIEGDALKLSLRSEEFSGVDVVINLIGIIRSHRVSGVTFPKLHVEATKNLLHAAKNAGVRKFIQMSANGAAPGGIAEYQRTKFEAEELVKNSSLDWTIFRPSIIFGTPPKGSTEFCTQLSGILRYSPFIPVFGDGKYRLQPIHVEDVAACFTAACENPKASRRIFHLGGDETYSYVTILDLICMAICIGAKRKVFLPWPLLKPFIRLLGNFAFFPATAYQIEMLLEGNCVPEREYKEVFGIMPAEFSTTTLGYLRDR